MALPAPVRRASTAIPAKRLAVFAVVLAGALLLAELGARGLAAWRGEPYSAAAAERELDEALSLMTDVLPGAGGETRGDEPRGAGGRYRLHPYTGYTLAAGLAVVEGCVEWFDDPAHEPQYDVFLFGGSVAALFASGKQGAAQELARTLERDPRLGGRSVRLWNFAVPGYKQPQQLELLAYLLSRGAEPDLVVNLDGLNELRMAYTNTIAGLPATWPSSGHWGQVLPHEGLDAEAVELLFDVRRAQDRARELVARTRRWHLTASCFTGRLQLRRLARLRSTWAEAQSRYARHLLERAEPSGRDSPPTKEELDAALEESLRCWYESSLAMHALCAARGARYLHAVQPNLADPGSKPLTPEEERKGLGKEGPHPAVLAGYPRLRELCAELREHGVEAVDLTRAFADVEETLYYDPAHFNRLGNRVLAGRLAAAWRRDG